jgi:hypothetical protein
MKKIFLSMVALFVAATISLSAAAKSKGKRKSRAASNKVVAASTKPDHEVRRLVRKQAPFMIDGKSLGNSIRVHKDGTFSREDETGAQTTEGHWKVVSGKLKLKWTSGEEKELNLGFAGKTTVIEGKKPDKEGRYLITAS